MYKLKRNLENEFNLSRIFIRLTYILDKIEEIKMSPNTQKFNSLELKKLKYKLEYISEIFLEIKPILNNIEYK